MPLLSSTFARTSLALMLAGVAVLLAIVLTSVWLAAKIDNLAEEVIRTRDIRIAATNLRAGLLDAETVHCVHDVVTWLPDCPDVGPPLRRLATAEEDLCASTP